MGRTHKWGNIVGIIKGLEAKLWPELYLELWIKQKRIPSPQCCIPTFRRYH
jgi:hypothetical protein